MAKKSEITAIYPGTFDPVTLGHIDIVIKASMLFKSIIVAVAENSSKQTLFSNKERLELASKSLASIKNVKVKSFNGLLVDFAKKEKASVIIRGLRTVTDFEYELQMSLTNKKLAPQVETVFFMPSEKNSYISSTLVREIIRSKGNIKYFVPLPVIKYLKSLSKV